MNYLEFLITAAVFAIIGWKLRGKRTVVIRPSESQWALTESLNKDMRTIARLKMQITHAEEANQDLRDELALAHAQLATRDGAHFKN